VDLIYASEFSLLLVTCFFVFVDVNCCIDFCAWGFNFSRLVGQGGIGGHGARGIARMDIWNAFTKISRRIDRVMRIMMEDGVVEGGWGV
jgi:hypothetical protein